MPLTQENLSKPTNDESTNPLRDKCFLLLQQAWEYRADKNPPGANPVGVAQLFNEEIPQEVLPAVTAILRLHGIIDSNGKLIQSSNSSERLTQHDHKERIEAVSRELDNFFKLEYVGFRELLNTAYPKELNRLVGGKQFSLSLDSVSQMTALVLLAKPFTNEDLQEEAKAELLTLLNNRFFTSLPQESDEQKMTAQLIEMVNKNADKFEMAGLVKQLATAVLNLPSASSEDLSSPGEEGVDHTYSSPGEVVDGNASPTYFQRHPNIRMGLAVTALVIGLAAIAVATVATCGVAGLLGGAAASIAATLTFGASLTTVGAVAGGVGLFGGLGVAAGSYLVHTRPGRGVVTRSQGVEAEEDDESCKKARLWWVRSLAVIQELEFFFTGYEVSKSGYRDYRDDLIYGTHCLVFTGRAKLIKKDITDYFRKAEEKQLRDDGSRILSL